MPGKRRALWRTAALADLDELRRFRHFIGTNYAAELKREKVLRIAEIALRVGPCVEADVKAFVAALGSGPATPS